MSGMSMGDRFEVWWENEGKFLPHDTEASRKHAARVSWHNSMYSAGEIVATVGLAMQGRRR
jgi:hypothetical protein